MSPIGKEVIGREVGQSTSLRNIHPDIMEYRQTKVINSFNMRE